ncbi:MAG: hypothetical protein PWQ96_149 [Clostridia bacterium]|nr:hypothetical protein [Clostridia bacterium]
MKKLFCITLVFVFLLAALPQASFAADIATFELGDGTTTYYGRKNLVNEISVPIRLLNLQNVFGAQAKLTFDTKISILGIPPGNIFDGKDYYEPESEIGMSSARYGATI